MDERQAFQILDEVTLSKSELMAWELYKINHQDCQETSWDEVGTENKEVYLSLISVFDSMGVYDDDYKEWEWDDEDEFL